MENKTIACAQQRMAIMDTRQEFEAQAGRFLYQARAKSAQLVIFPELTGLMLAPGLISGFKLGFIKRADQGNKPSAGALRRQLGRVSGAAAEAIGGGFRGSLVRLLSKSSDALLDLYLDTFGKLAREYGTAILGGSLYVLDPETQEVHNRAYLFNANGEVLGYQDKLNLNPDEEEIAQPGNHLSVLDSPQGKLGLLLGRDALYPELARVLAMQGADVLIGIAASAGIAQANVYRSAMAMRTEENQTFGVVGFLLGPDYVGQEGREDYFGQSAILAPISLTGKGDGVLAQAGTNRTEGLIAAELDREALYNLRESSRFRPRSQMNLGNHGADLADFYRDGQTIEQAAAQYATEWQAIEPDLPIEPVPEYAPLAVEDQWEDVSVFGEPEAEVPVEMADEELSTAGDEESGGLLDEPIEELDEQTEELDEQAEELDEQIEEIDEPLDEESRTE